MAGIVHAGTTVSMSKEISSLPPITGESIIVPVIAHATWQQNGRILDRC